MWAHRPWVGRFFPSGTKPGTELPLYARWCNAVEGNTTFYAEPLSTTIEKWSEQAPDDFRFAFKLPRLITHDRRLRDVAREVRSFLDAVEPLGDRVGPIQVQLPRSFGPESLDVLRLFVRRLPLDWAWALELRHPSFFDGSAARHAVDEMCLSREIGRVVLDSRALYATPADSDAARDERRSKPDLPIVLDAVGKFPIIRVIGEDSPDGTLAGIMVWVDQVIAWIGEGREPYVFAHQPENLDSPGLARAFHEAVAARLPTLAPLPEPTGQASMF
jgi:uncharacterized protein YecE (DUF72 family)